MSALAEPLGDRHKPTLDHDHALLALLIGCGLRRQELAQLKFEEIVEREGRAAIVDLGGEGKADSQGGCAFLGEAEHRPLDSSGQS
jgi:integrase